MISLLFIILASICNAFMDVLDDHWYKSIFRTIKNPFWFNFFGDATNESWKNKYIDRDHTKEFVKLKILGFTFNKPMFLTDGWHLSKSLMITFMVLSVVSYPLFTIEYPLHLFLNNFKNLFPFINAFINFVLFGTCWNLVFNTFYNKILENKK